MCCEASDGALGETDASCINDVIKNVPFVTGVHGMAPIGGCGPSSGGQACCLRGAFQPASPPWRGSQPACRSLTTSASNVSPGLALSFAAMPPGQDADRPEEPGHVHGRSAIFRCGAQHLHPPAGVLCMSNNHPAGALTACPRHACAGWAYPCRLACCVPWVQASEGVASHACWSAACMWRCAAMPGSHAHIFNLAWHRCACLQAEAVRDYTRTDASLTAWQLGMNALYQRIVDNTPAGEISDNSLEFKFDGEHRRYMKRALFRSFIIASSLSQRPTALLVCGKGSPQSPWA